jgi:hypothetical protein
VHYYATDAALAEYLPLCYREARFFSGCLAS